MSLKILWPYWVERNFKDETAFRDFQKTLFNSLPSELKTSYAQDYRKMVGGGDETPDFHNCVEAYCWKVEQYLQTVTDINTPDVLPEEITLLRQKHARLIQLLTRSSHLSHTLAWPKLYETHIRGSDLHEAFHEERNVAPTAPIHHKLHFLLRDWEILMFLLWIQKLVLSWEVEKPVQKIHEPKKVIHTAFSVLGKLQWGLKAYITGGSKGDLKNTLAEIKAQLQALPWWAQILKEEEKKLKKKKF